MPASGLASSANRTTGARSTGAGSSRKPMPATATKVRKGAIERATAPATENITSGKLVLPNFERQSPPVDDGATGARHGSGIVVNCSTAAHFTKSSMHSEL